MTTYTSNTEQTNNINLYDKFTKEFDLNIDFLKDLSDLICDNGFIIPFITPKAIHTINTCLIDSSAQTLNNIKYCCSNRNFSDANTLIRKLRDDLLLYIFILDVIKNRNPFNIEDLNSINFSSESFDIEKTTSAILNIRYNQLTENEQAIEAWFNNKVNVLPKNIKKLMSFENYMKHLQHNSLISEILNNYNLKEYWEELRKKLNDFVHNNGIQFTYQNLVLENDNNLKIHLHNVNYRTSYIVSFFLVLILMTASNLISSPEMIENLDMNLVPPEDCQYSIAVFVQEFIDNKVAKLHPGLKQYLKENNNHGMRII